jgi:hypothetical protein
VRIFLSSPYRQLADTRETLKAALEHDGHEVVAMEEFGSSGRPSLETCLRAMRNCEVCVVLVGYVYGSTVPGAPISYSEAEYEEAQRRGMQIFAYIRADFEDGVRRAPQADSDRTRQANFKVKIESELNVEQDYFASDDQLIEQVRRDVSRWARGSSSPSFRKKRWPIRDPAAYASELVRRSEQTLFDRPVILVNLPVAREEKYPVAAGGRLVRKVRDIQAELEAKGYRAALFNALPVADLTVGSHFQQRLDLVQQSGALVVCFVDHESDLDLLREFELGPNELIVWHADRVSEASVSAARYRSQYTSEELSDCSLGLEAVQWLQREIESHILKSLAGHA